ncbi:MAG: hypothetical protein AAGF73_19135 [Actinomycetota bacterium]
MSDDVSPAADSQWGRIAEIDAALSSIDRSDFAQRAALTAERAEIVQQLREMNADDEQLRSWAEDSAVVESDRPTPYIASHSEGGGASA